MATEDPQTLPLDQKAPSTAVVDQMAVDEADVPATVNGCVHLYPVITSLEKHLAHVMITGILRRNQLSLKPTRQLLAMARLHHQSHR
jgi:hypothetical protein